MCSILNSIKKKSQSESGSSIGASKNEIEQYIGVLVTMSFIKLPTQRMYWQNRTRIPGVADIMTSKRFEKLKRYLHFSDNEEALPKNHPKYDKLQKVRPLIDSVVQKCRSIPPQERHAIDEQIIPTKGRSGLR